MTHRKKYLFLCQCYSFWDAFSIQSGLIQKERHGNVDIGFEDLYTVCLAVALMIE